MAALTSSQSGNWTSSSTWGGSTPADGDTFTISRGHKVTVNSDVRTTNGFGDIQCYGNLHIATGGKFRLDGRITVRGNNSVSSTTVNTFGENDTDSGGLFSAEGNNIVFEVEGSNSEQHGIWVENERHASIIIRGDYKRTNTELSAVPTVNNAYITVDSVSGFAAGDWIAVFNDDDDLDHRVQSDEGFWVHDVDSTNKRLYIRQYVSPSTSVTAVSGTTVTVENAKVFRKGYRLICDTGSNRREGTVSSIDYVNNKLTMSSAFVSANVGKTIYQSGVEKDHEIDDTVEKIATTITTAVSTANSTNQITVGSSSDISVGDTIVIDVNNDTDTNWNYDSKYTVSSKSGNTLTLNRNVAHVHKAGSIVQILDRHIVFKGVDSDVRPFLLVEYWTSTTDTATRHVCIKNVEFDTWGGNSNSTYYRGVMIAGYNSFSDQNSSNGNRDFASRFQGNTIHDSVGNNDYNGFSFRHSYNLIVRNNFAFGNGSMQRGFWFWSTQYSPKVYNNYMTRFAYACMYFDASYDPYVDISYNYMTRSDDYAFLQHQNREGHIMSHNICLNNENRSIYLYYQGNNTTTRRWYCEGFRHFPYKGNSDGTSIILDSYFNAKWYKNWYDESAPVGASLGSSWYGYGGMDWRSNYYNNPGGNALIKVYEANFHHDEMLEFGYDSMLRMQKDGTWKGYHLRDSAGMFWHDAIYVPANTKARISCKIKGENNSNYNFPILFACDNINTYAMGRWQTNYTGQTGYKTSTTASNRFKGWREEDQASSAMRGAFETLQLTIQPQTHGYMMAYGIRVGGSENIAEEPVYFTEPEVFFEEARVLKSRHDGKNATRSGFTRAKKRIGGTRL
jgi:hypothetical protein